MIYDISVTIHDTELKAIIAQHAFAKVDINQPFDWATAKVEIELLQMGAYKAKVTLLGAQEKCPK